MTGTHHQHAAPQNPCAGPPWRPLTCAARWPHGPAEQAQPPKVALQLLHRLLHLLHGLDVGRVQQRAQRVGVGHERAHLGVGL